MLFNRRYCSWKTLSRKKRKCYIQLNPTFKNPKQLKPRARKPQKCRHGEKRLITKRPERVESRKYAGDWEGDLIEFKGNKKQSVRTFVERKTRMVFLIKNETEESQSIMMKIQKRLSIFPQSICKTITFDQGYEFSQFHCLEKPLESQVFYCLANSPSEKGSNENMNGRLRWHHLPKDIDITNVTQNQLDEIANKMKMTPRKKLVYRTPNRKLL